MSSWSIKGHQFCHAQYILQCHRELSSCPLSDLRKYRRITLSWWDFRGLLFEEDICQQHIMMVQFLLLSSCHQWLLMGQKLQAAFLSAGKKRQGHTGKYQQLIKFFKLQRKLFSRAHQASPAPLCVMDCVWSQQGVQLLTASGNRASVCGLNSKMLSELQTDFL